MWLTNLRLKSSTPRVRRQAIESLAAGGDFKAIESICAALSDSDAEVRSAAAKALGDLDHSPALPQLIACLRDASPEVREAAAVGLMKIGDSESIPPLLWCLRDTNSSVRGAVAAALRNLGWRPSTSEEKAFMDIASGNTRAAAWAGQAAVDPLVDELTNDTNFQRRAAAEALEQVFDSRAVKPLLVAVGRPDPTLPVFAHFSAAPQTTEAVVAATPYRL